MNETDTSERSESSFDVARAETVSGREYAAQVAPYLRRSVESGTSTAVVGGAALLGGFRAFRRGERRRGLAGLVLGVALLAVAVAQRRSGGAGRESDVEDTDVVGTGPGVEAIADEAGGVGDEDHVGGEAAERETEDASDSLASEDVDRLGEAAFDAQSHEVPAPQRAFNQGYLAHSTETFWGVRARDDAVLVSQDYDAVEGRDGVQYVASSAIGDDVRELPIPDAILDHWDEVLGGGTAVTGGDGILFATTDDLAAHRLLWVLPAEWADDVFGEPEPERESR